MTIRISRRRWVSRTFASLVHRIGHSILPRPGVVFHHVHADVQVRLAVPQVEVAPRLNTPQPASSFNYHERLRRKSPRNRGKIQGNFCSKRRWLRAGSVCLGSTYAPYSAGEGPSSARRMCQSRSVLNPLVSPAGRTAAPSIAALAPFPDWRIGRQPAL